MTTQRNIAHVDDETIDLKVTFYAGNANIASALMSVDGQQINRDVNGNSFMESTPFNLGRAGNLIGKTIEIFADLAQNPAVQSNTLILSYDISNVTWVIPNKRHTLTSDAAIHDIFDINIDLI